MIVSSIEFTPAEKEWSINNRHRTEAIIVQVQDAEDGHLVQPDIRVTKEEIVIGFHRPLPDKRYRMVVSG